MTNSRFRGFFWSLLASSSLEVGILARLAVRDIRSSLGSGLALLQRETSLDPWICPSAQLRAALVLVESVPVPDTDLYRLDLLRKYISLKQTAFYARDTEEERKLKGLIDSLVIN